MASIQVGTRRPFVVGVIPVGRAAQPQIRVVDCGLQLNLRPVVRPGNKLWLECAVKQSRIEDVFTRTVKAAGFDEPVTLQVPKVQEVKFESTVELEFGKTVAIGA